MRNFATDLKNARDLMHVVVSVLEQANQDDNEIEDLTSPEVQDIYEKAKELEHLLMMVATHYR